MSNRLLNLADLMFPLRPNSISSDGQGSRQADAVDNWTSRRPMLLPPQPIPGKSRAFLTPKYPFLPRDNHSACAETNGNIYIFGGGQVPNSNDVFVYSSSDNTVRFLETYGDIPTARGCHSSAIYRKALIVFGGWLDPLMSNELYILNLVSHEWTRIDVDGPAPVPRHYHSSCMIGTKFFVFGGLSDSRYLNDVWAFDLNTLHTRPAWELIRPSSPRRPPSRLESACISYQGNLIVLGGANESSCFNDSWSFNLETKIWTKLRDLPCPSLGHGGITMVGDVLYSYDISTCSVLDLSIKTSLVLKNTATAPSSRRYHATASVGNKVFVFGGVACGESGDFSWGVYHATDSDLVFILDTEQLF